MKLLNKFVLALSLFVTLVSCSEAQTSNGGVAKDLNIQQFESKMKEEGVVILDVRTKEEVNQGMIEGAQNIDFFDADFDKELDKLDKNKTYAVYCRSGGRSGKAMKMMNEKGFKDVYNLVGGFNGWSQSGKPVKK